MLYVLSMATPRLRRVDKTHRLKVQSTTQVHLLDS